MPSDRRTVQFLRWLLARVRLSVLASARVSLHALIQLWARLCSLSSRLVSRCGPFSRKDACKLEGNSVMHGRQSPVFAGSFDPSSQMASRRPVSIAAPAAAYPSDSITQVSGGPSVLPTWTLRRSTLERPNHSSPELTTPEATYLPTDYPPIQGNVMDTAASMGLPPSSRPSSPRPTSVSLDPTPMLSRPTSVSLEPAPISSSTQDETITLNDLSLTRTAVPTSDVAPGPLPSSNGDYLRDNNIKPIDIESIKRYSRAPISQLCGTDRTIKAMQRQFSRGTVPKGWEQYLHPEGAAYFHHPEEGVLTDANLYDHQTFKKIDKFMRHMTIAKEKHSADFPDKAEIVLELPPTGDTDVCNECYYYCIDHDNRAMFWLNDFNAQAMLDQSRGLSHEAQIQHEIEAQYWMHWEYFPLNREVQESLLQEAVGRLVHGAVDQKTSKLSTFPYSAEDTVYLLDLVKSVNYTKEAHGFSAVVIGRVMSSIARSKFLNHHGSPEARLCRNQRIHPDNGRPPSLWITLVSPLLFFAPDMHYRQIRKVWVDYTVMEQSWVHLIKAMQFEWDKYVLPATVMLSANLAFLAIPSMDLHPERVSVPEIACFISTFHNVVSIIIGMVLYRNYRLSEHFTADEAADYLSCWDHHGIESLAIIYSLPYALMMWGMATFFFACSWQFVQRHTALNCTFLAVVAFFSIAALGVSVFVSWDAKHPWLRQLGAALFWSSPKKPSDRTTWSCFSRKDRVTSHANV